MMPRLFAPTVARAVLIALALFAGLAHAGLAHAAPTDRKTLLLRGRVTDAEAWPIGDIKMSVTGDRRAGATTDASGQYELKVPLGSASELARHPVALRVRGVLKGWRITLPGGEPELGLALRVVAGDDGVVRCEIQSNHANVTSAVARLLTTDGDAVGLGAVNFLATRGAPDDAPASLELPATDRVALAGVAVSAVPGPEPKAKAVKPEARAKAPPPPREDRRKADHAAGRKSTAPSEDASTALELARREPKVDAAAEQRRLREEKRERERLDKLAKEEERDRLRREAKDRKSAARAEQALAKDRDAHQARWNDLQKEVQLIAGATDTTSAPPVPVLETMAGTPQRTENRGRPLPRRAMPSKFDTVRVRPPRELPEPPPPRVAPTTPPSQGTLAGGAPSTPVKPPTPSRALAPTPSRTSAPASRAEPPPVAASDAAADRGPRVFPAPDGEARARSRPLVIRSASPATNATDGNGEPCTCRIQGTVEVRSDEPLASRQRVVVSLVWYPAIADTVELFMGSPRGFKLPPAPCGPQRLKVVSLGSMRFDVVSREAMAGFRCEADALHQPRLVLAPR